MGNAVSSSTRELVEKALENNVKLPELPVEVWHTIYGYLDTRNLLKARQVSKSWNDFILQYVEPERIKIKFRSVREVSLFYHMMTFSPHRDPRIQFFKFQVPLYKIPIAYALNKLTSLVGSYALEYDLNVGTYALQYNQQGDLPPHRALSKEELLRLDRFQHNNDTINLKMNTLIIGSPNLEVLRITIDAEFEEVYLNRTLPLLRQLVELSLVLKTNAGQYKRKFRCISLPLETISEWIESTPSLKIFRNDFYLNCEHEIIPYFNMLQHLSEVHLSLHLRIQLGIEVLEKISKVPIKIKTLKLHLVCDCNRILIQNFFRAITSLLLNQSDTLKELSLSFPMLCVHSFMPLGLGPHNHFLELPPLRKLEKIHFSYVNHGFITPLLQENFPSLKFLSLDPSVMNHRTEITDFLTPPFSTVHTLAIPDVPSTFRNGWKMCLPNLTSFHSNGNLEHIDSASDVYTVEELVLYMDNPGNEIVNEWDQFTGGARVRFKSSFWMPKNHCSASDPETKGNSLLFKYTKLKVLDVRGCTPEIVMALAYLSCHRIWSSRVELILSIHETVFPKVDTQWLDLLKQRQKRLKVILYD